MAVLTFERVDVCLDRRAVLRDLDFAVEAGEIIGVLGANGAGKTSLLRAISGELDCRGEIYLAGRAVRQWDLHERACHLAVLPQFSVLNFPYSVAEVVALGRVPHATGKRENQAIVDEVMALMDVTAIRHQLYTRLSGGEKRRAQLARVLAQIWCRGESANSNRVLLLDEPGAALDLLHRQSLLEVFEKLRQQGTAIIVVEHDLNFAVRFADRLLALGEGGVVAFGTSGQVITEAVIRRLYQVDATILPHPHSGQPVVIN